MRTQPRSRASGSFPLGRLLWAVPFLRRRRLHRVRRQRDPVGPERCSAFVDMYVPPGADEVIIDEWLKMWDQVLREDAEATNRRQLGYGSGKIPAGCLMLKTEHNLQAFMSRTYQALALMTRFLPNSSDCSWSASTETFPLRKANAGERPGES